jgi:Domain of unknown function (DUF4123)/Inner membrane component of T3SS, cytoplasmic domain
LRAIVEVRWGPLRGRKLVLDPGGSVRVGRSDRADLVVEDDRQMSALHFAVSWDGQRCQLRRLTDAAETSLNGEPITTEATVENGDWIKAGETVFGVYVEEHTPPRRGSGAGMTPVRESALDALSAAGGPLFAVLDAARDDRIVEVLHESVEENRSLYDGLKGEALADVAPYLVSLPPGARLLRRLVEEGWGRRWGIYLTCARPFVEVRRHLRRFLMVSEEDTDKRLYFRFYDPGTLRSFVPSCLPRQAAEMFGPVGAFVCEGAGGEVLRFDAPAEAAPDARARG